jgi:type II secretory pathway pseudopilin PulG
VLLEAVVALTILAVAGVAAVAMASESARTIAHIRETEAELRAASALMEAASLWTREDLDRRLGDRAQGPWRLRIDRPVPTLYTLTLTDSLGRAELLRTAIFRPEAAHGEP